MFLFQIGFIDITFWDFLDVTIVTFLLFRVYKLLKGSIGFNIFVGLLLIYVSWWGVSFLDMPLLSSILGQFVSVGMIALLILFQPEARRFLIYVGQGSFESRFKSINRIFKLTGISDENNPLKEKHIRSIVRAFEQLAQTKTGALMVIANQTNLEGLYSSGVVLNADLSTQLLVSIFNKDSPLHDGAIIVNGHKISAASCVLPVSKNPTIPQQLGLRHRAAIGITESTNFVAFTVSEENGTISYARNGQINQDISPDSMHKLLQKILFNQANA